MFVGLHMQSTVCMPACVRRLLPCLLQQSQHVRAEEPRWPAVECL